MFLIDTNIFLEILLDQDKKEICKDFLKNHIENLHLSDFSLHSIGVILLREKQAPTFQIFLNQFLSDITLLALPKYHYDQIPINSQKFLLDFDDAYQYTLAKFYGFSIVTLDKHFKKINDIQKVLL